MQPTHCTNMLAACWCIDIAAGSVCLLESAACYRLQRAHGNAANCLQAVPPCSAVSCPAVLSAAWQLLSVQRSLTAYYDRFKAVLNPINAQNIQRLLHIASALHKCMQQQQTPVEGQQQPVASSSSSRLTTVNDLLFDLGLDNINMFDLAHWVRDNKMAFKVSMRTSHHFPPVQLQARLQVELQ